MQSVGDNKTWLWFNAGGLMNSWFEGGCTGTTGVQRAFQVIGGFIYCVGCMVLTCVHCVG